MPYSSNAARLVMYSTQDATDWGFEHVASTSDAVDNHRPEYAGNVSSGRLPVRFKPKLAALKQNDLFVCAASNYSPIALRETRLGARCLECLAVACDWHKAWRGASLLVHETCLQML